MLNQTITTTVTIFVACPTLEAASPVSSALDRMVPVLESIAALHWADKFTAISTVVVGLVYTFRGWYIGRRWPPRPAPDNLGDPQTFGPEGRHGGGLRRLLSCFGRWPVRAPPAQARDSEAQGVGERQREEEGPREEERVVELDNIVVQAN